MFQFKYSLNDKDYLDFKQFHMLHSPSSKRHLLMLRLIMPVMLVILLVIYCISDFDWIALIIRATIYALISVIWIALMKPYSMLWLKRDIKLLKMDGKLPYERDALIRFEEDFLLDISEMNESKYMYASIERIAVGKSAVYLYTNAIQAFIIPFAVFESMEQRDAFLAFIHQKVSQGS